MTSSFSSLAASQHSNTCGRFEWIHALPTSGSPDKPTTFVSFHRLLPSPCSPSPLTRWRNHPSNNSKISSLRVIFWLLWAGQCCLLTLPWHCRSLQLFWAHLSSPNSAPFQGRLCVSFTFVAPASKSKRVEVSAFGINGWAYAFENDSRVVSNFIPFDSIKVNWKLYLPCTSFL